MWHRGLIFRESRGERDRLLPRRVATGQTLQKIESVQRKSQRDGNSEDRYQLSALRREFRGHAIHGRVEHAENFARESRQRAPREGHAANHGGGQVRTLDGKLQRSAADVGQKCLRVEARRQRRKLVLQLGVLLRQHQQRLDQILTSDGVLREHHLVRQDFRTIADESPTHLAEHVPHSFPQMTRTKTQEVRGNLSQHGDGQAQDQQHCDEANQGIERSKHAIAIAGGNR